MNPLNNINFFSKPITKISEPKRVPKAFRYDLSLTTQRVNIGKQRIITTRNLCDFQTLLTLKRATSSSILRKDIKREEYVRKEIIKIMLNYESYYIHIPSWNIIFDILLMMNLDQNILTELKEVYRRTDSKSQPFTLNFNLENLKWLQMQLRNIIKVYKMRIECTKKKERVTLPV